MRFINPRAARVAAVMLLPFPAFLGAQQREPGVRIERFPDIMSIAMGGSSNRAVLGVTMGSASRADTNGVRIESVDANGPAAKSGLKAGDVITSINGVSLKVSSADAEDPALLGIAQRRLTRTMAKAKAGDAVELRVQNGSASRTVSVKTISAAELDGQTNTRATARVRSDDDTRGVIGISIGGSGNARDTLGLFINAVTSNGPAEKAGILEGERIASVNGVDVRVPREDMEDANALSARASRFVREVQKVAPGGTVALRVYGGGRYRDVSVKAVKSSELPSQGFRMSIGDGGMVFSLPRGSNLREGTLMPAMPMGQGGGRIRIDGNSVEVDREALERAMQELRRNMQDMGRDLRLQFRSDSSLPRGGTIYRTSPRRATLQ